MLPGKSKTYEKFAVETLPEGSNAGSIRPGACNTLGSEMPGEFAVHTTGHDMTKVSAPGLPLALTLALTLACPWPWPETWPDPGLNLGLNPGLPLALA